MNDIVLKRLFPLLVKHGGNFAIRGIGPTATECIVRLGGQQVGFNFDADISEEKFIEQYLEPAIAALARQGYE